MVFSNVFTKKWCSLGTAGLVLGISCGCTQATPPTTSKSAPESAVESAVSEADNSETPESVTAAKPVVSEEGEPATPETATQKNDQPAEQSNVPETVEPGTQDTPESVPAVEESASEESLIEEPTTETSAESAAEANAKPQFRQTRTIDLQNDIRFNGINTFCLDNEGRFLVAVDHSEPMKVPEAETKEAKVDTSETDEAQADDSDVAAKPAVKSVAGLVLDIILPGSKTAAVPGLKTPAIRVYSPDGKLEAVWNVGFEPQSMNVGPNGAMFVAGDGKIAKLDRDGNVVKSGPTPQIEDPEKIEEIAKAALNEMTSQRTAVYDQQISTAEKLLDKLKEKPEEDRTKMDELRIRRAESTLNSAKSNRDRVSKSYTLDWFMSYKLKVPGLAVTEKDVFVALSTMNGFGYEVWRVDHDFGNPTKICDGLSGCCGNMDIQSDGIDVFVAENSRHRVRRFNRDGKELAVFGERVSSNKTCGFDGCCNPMNLRFTPEGDVLTAESGAGLIKRFTPEGEFVCSIGKADLQSGCKHVAIAASKDGSKMFMIDVPREAIIVLEKVESTSDVAGNVSENSVSLARP